MTSKSDLPAPFRPKSKKKHVGPIRALEFSPCGRMLASGGHDASVRIWDPSTLKQLRVEKKRDPIYRVDHLAFGPGWAEIVILSTHGGGGRDRDDTFIGIWNAVSGEYRIRDMVIDVGEPNVSPHGRALAFGGQGLFSYDHTSRTRANLPHEGRCHAVAFSADGVLLAAASDETVSIYRVETKAQVAVWRVEEAVPRCLAFLPDPGRTAVAIGESDGSIRVWDTATVTAKWLGDPAPAVRVIALGGGRLISVHRNEETHLWSLQLWSEASGACVAAHALPKGITAVAISPTGSYAATGSKNGKVSVMWCESLLPGTLPPKDVKPISPEPDEDI